MAASSGRPPCSTVGANRSASSCPSRATAWAGHWSSTPPVRMATRRCLRTTPSMPRPARCCWPWKRRRYAGPPGPPARSCSIGWPARPASRRTGATWRAPLTRSATRPSARCWAPCAFRRRAHPRRGSPWRICQRRSQDGPFPGPPAHARASRPSCAFPSRRASTRDRSA